MRKVSADNLPDLVKAIQGGNVPEDLRDHLIRLTTSAVRAREGRKRSAAQATKTRSDGIRLPIREAVNEVMTSRPELQERYRNFRRRRRHIEWVIAKWLMGQGIKKRSERIIRDEVKKYLGIK